MNRLTLQVYQDSTQAVMIADWTTIAQGITFETGDHGYANLKAFIPMPKDMAFRIYESLHFAHVVLSAYGFHAFEGRIEDPDMKNGGIQITVFGYWRAFSDLPYTATWSAQEYGQWFIMTENDLANTKPDMFETRISDSLFIGLQKNESYTTSDIGRIGFTTPSIDGNPILRVKFDYSYQGGSNYRARFVSYTSSIGTGGTVEWTLTGTGATQTGSQDITLTNSGDVYVLMFQNEPTASVTHSGDSGAGGLEITNVRVMGTSSANVYADEIVGDIISHVNAVNSNQISSSTGLIESPGTDLFEAYYRDEQCDKILNKLLESGDSSTPTKYYEIVVWENQLVGFRQQGSQGQTWYVDIGDISINSTIENLYNSAYATYDNNRGSYFRTSFTSDASSISRYGVTRRTYVKSKTTDSTEAGTWADALLEDKKDITPKTKIQVSQIFNANGAMVPIWYPRASDTIVIRNLPPTAGETVDKIRSFICTRTSCNLENGTLTLTPAEPIDSLDVLVAKHEASFVG